MQTLLLKELMERYVPGSYDATGWSWQDEFDNVEVTFGFYFDDLVTQIQKEGIKNPILLGDDGRVWDGHKRLTAAHLLAFEEVPVEYAKDLKYAGRSD